MKMFVFSARETI